MTSKISYYCPYCKKHFDHWAVGHAGWNDVCAGGCNTSRKQMWQLYIKS